MYDKYRNWLQPGGITPSPRMPLERQVLKDLDSVTDEVEKFEILDSYAAYIQRAYQQDVALTYSRKAGDAIASVLNHYILAQMPPVYIPHRPRSVPAGNNPQPRA
jgi:hypothetical protein